MTNEESRDRRGNGGHRGPDAGRTFRSAALLSLFFLVALTLGGAELRLLDAVKAGNGDAVRALLKQPKVAAEVNAQEADGTTALQWAARADDRDIAKALLDAHADPNIANRYGVRPLSLAAGNASAAMTELLLNAGADANAPLPEGQTLLMAAARTGNPDVVRLLLARGVNVNARENLLGETALMWAAAENHPEAVALLVQHGAEIDGRTSKLAFPKDRFGLEGVLTILPHGSWTALMYAGRQGSLGAARALVEAGANVNLVDPDGSTAMVLAIINGHYDVAAMLTEKGANPNIADSTGMAALYAAVDMNTLGEVYGRPGRKSTSAVSALELMKVLIAHGADPNAQLRSATLQRAHTPGEGLLGDGSTPLMRAAKNGDAAAITLLLDRGADPALTQRNHTTALMFAAGLGRGQGVFAKDYATERELLAAVKVLIEHGVDVNAFNDTGQTAMHCAAQASDDIVRYLAAHGAALEPRDRQGRTPVDLALGVGLRGRAGGPPPVREKTAELIKQLIAERNGKASGN